MKNAKKKEPSLLWFVCVLVCLVSLGIFLTHKVNEKPTRIKPTLTELQDRYDYLRTHAASTNVHPLLRPIHFRVGDRFAASGTLVLKKDGTPWEILTANHLFSETQPSTDYYDYYILTSAGYTNRGHVSGVTLDSIRHSDRPEGIEDIAICTVGDPAPIARTSKVRVSAEKPFEGEYRAGKIEPFDVISVLTGEQYKIIGEIINDDNAFFYVMLYSSLNGESGSGFWAGDGKLLILSGGIDVNPTLRKDLGIPDSYQTVTMLSAAKINW